MGNNQKRESFFKFKKFSISDSAGAMKIGTDGVLLGAWAPVEGIHRAIDIGCGTGLISIMLAQRGVEDVIGIEIDKRASIEASNNIANCEWKENISVINSDVTSIDLSIYSPDLIVSNPPFFSDSLHCNDETRRIARHEGNLNYRSLIELSSRALGGNGLLAFISPIEREHDIVFYASMNKMFVYRQTFVKTVSSKNPKRILWLLGKKICSTVDDVIQIKTASGEYSIDYINLTKDFYIHL
ncbi:MAG: methyltransferase [Paramuribaculum sp.]|nr:methyltransferase [Paramuribaculum sp.]